MLRHSRRTRRARTHQHATVPNPRSAPRARLGGSKRMLSALNLSPRQGDLCAASRSRTVSSWRTSTIRRCKIVHHMPELVRTLAQPPIILFQCRLSARRHPRSVGGPPLRAGRRAPHLVIQFAATTPRLSADRSWMRALPLQAAKPILVASRRFGLHQQPAQRLDSLMRITSCPAEEVRVQALRPRELRPRHRQEFGGVRNNFVRSLKLPSVSACTARTDTVHSALSVHERLCYQTEDPYTLLCYHRARLTSATSCGNRRYWTARSGSSRASICCMRLAWIARKAKFPDRPVGSAALVTILQHSCHRRVSRRETAIPCRQGFPKLTLHVRQGSRAISRQQGFDDRLFVHPRCTVKHSAVSVGPLSA